MIPTNVRRPSRFSTIALFSAAGLLFETAAVAQSEFAEVIDKSGDLATKWKVNDAYPKSGIPSVAERNKDPMEFAYFLQDLAARAESSFQKADWVNAIKFYEALGHAVPDSWISFSRLCTAYAKQGKFAIAAGNCGKAVSLPMAKVMDHIRFIEYSLKSERFGANEINGIEDSLAQLRKHLAEHPQPELPVQPAAPTVATAPNVPDTRTKEEILEAVKQRQLQMVADNMAGIEKKTGTGPVMYLPAEVELLSCQLAVKVKDAKRLGTCIEELRRLHVNEAQIMGFSWAHALTTKDQDGASAIVKKARSLGVPEATVASMEAQQKQAFPAVFNMKKLLPAFAVAGVALAASAFFVRRKKSVRAAG